MCVAYNKTTTHISVLGEFKKNEVRKLQVWTPKATKRNVIGNWDGKSTSLKHLPMLCNNSNLQHTILIFELLKIKSKLVLSPFHFGKKTYEQISLNLKI